MGTARHANGRREPARPSAHAAYDQHLYAAGRSTPQEIIESVEYGIMDPTLVAVRWISHRKFVFSTSEAYLIENGKKTKPVKGATSIGFRYPTMQQISMVGTT
ncbi:metallopeptidase TldD-related protein [Shigella flexneri]